MDRATLFKLAALTENVIRKLRPILAEFSGQPIEEILVKHLPLSWGSRRGLRISLRRDLPAVDQLITLVHEATHTPRVKKLHYVRKALMRRKTRLPVQRRIEEGYKIRRGVTPGEEALRGLSLSEERGVRLVERGRTIRFLRYLKQRDPRLFEKAKKRILVETKQPTLRRAIEEHIPRNTRKDIDEAIAFYREMELF